MTKIKKIIPTVLLSGAMVMTVPQLTSPTIANAYESNNYILNNNSIGEVCPLKFKFYSNNDKEQAVYVLVDGQRVNEITVDGKKDLCIKGLDRVNELRIEVTKADNDYKHCLYHNQISPLNVKFCVNGDDQGIYFLLNKRHVNKIDINSNSFNSKQNIYIEGLNNVNKLEIKPTK